LRVLLLQAVNSQSEQLKRELRKAELPFVSRQVRTRLAFLKSLRQFRPDIILSDYAGASFGGMPALKAARGGFDHIPFIFVSDPAGEECVIEALTGGATGYILRNHMERLVPAVHRAMAAAEQRRRREMAQQVLRQNKLRLSEAQRIAHLGNWDWNIVENQLWWSLEAYRIFGVVPGDLYLSYEGFLAYVHPDDRKFVDLAVHEALFERKQYSVEHRVVRPDGTERIVRECAEVTYDDRGSAVRMLGTVQDITEQKQMEAAIEVEHKRLYSVLNMLPACVSLHLPREKTIRFVNHKFLDFFGNPYGQPCHKVFWGEDKPCEICYARRVLETGKPLEWERTNKSGRTLHIWAYPYTDIDGTRVVLKLGIDVTERKHAEDEVRSDRAKLKSLTSELVRVEENQRRKIATELHDSLGQILAFSKIELAGVRRKVPEALSEPLNRILGLIDQAIEHARTLTFDISPPELHTLGLEAAVEELARQFTKKRGLECRFTSCGQAKPLAEDMKVLLYRAIQELLTNTVKHAGAKSVKVDLRRCGDEIRVTVEDDGRGFDASILDKPGEKLSGFGLFSIRERLTHVGGRFRIATGAEGGARVMLAASLTPGGVKQESGL